MADNKTKFIRRNGRVIPIRAKDANKSLVKRPGAPPPPKQKKRESKFKAASAFGGGVLASLFGGSVLAEFGKEAAFRKESAKGLFKRGRDIKRQAEALAAGTTSIPQKDIAMLKKQAKTFTKAGAFHRARGSAIGKQGFRVGSTALGVGSFLVGFGLAQAAEELFGKQNSETKSTLITAGGTIATSAAAFEFGTKTGVSQKAARKFMSAILKGAL